MTLSQKDSTNPKVATLPNFSQFKVFKIWKVSAIFDALIDF
jgi:hypothetical protein